MGGMTQAGDPSHRDAGTRSVVAADHTQVMSEHERTLEIVGDNFGANFALAGEFFAALVAEATDGDVLSALDRKIESAHSSLVRCLSGYDSYDTLAFIRMAGSLGDFTDRHESQTKIETSQAVQDVIALTLLGEGLPRRPLTGQNSGQPNIGRATKLASTIVAAAQTRALFQSQQIRQPLGSLAGEFMGYELSVRGRQYQSVATQMNTDLLAGPAVANIIRTALGFDLHDIRAVRVASVEQLNERFFGARDRTADAVTGDKNAIDRDAFLADMNLIMNECRLFGAVSAAEIADRTSVPEQTVAAVLDYFSSRKPSPDELNPALRYAHGQRPTTVEALADSGEYLLLNGFLGEDELRRSIERGLLVATDKGGRKAWDRYNRQRADYTEKATGAALTKLFAGTRPHWEGQNYVGPVAIDHISALGPAGIRTGLETKTYESDLLFVIDGVAICIEVKAGSVTAKARSGNAQRLAADLQKTLKDGNEQAERLTQLLRTNHGVWTDNKTWLSVPDIEEVHTIIVMLDDLGPLSLSMNELANKGIIETDEIPWIVSLHDLIVMSKTFDHPAHFLEYLRRRRGRRLATMVTGVDELDMFMWFLDGGMYFDPDPEDTASQVPIDLPTISRDKRRFDDQGRVRLGTLTDPLDAWFYSSEGLSQAQAPKPRRIEVPWVEDYLATSELAQSPGWLRFGADLIGLSEDAQRHLGNELNRQCRNARSGDRERSITSHGTTSTGSWLLTMSAVPEGASTDHLAEYMDAKQYQTHATRSMLLMFDTDGRLQGSRYRGAPFTRTPELDAAIAVAPLKSLAETFHKAPPSARRATRQLRGKRSGKKGKRR